MMRRTSWIAVVGVAVGASVLLSGCANGSGPRHEMTVQEQDHVIHCQLCYDQVVKVRNATPKGRSYRLIERHACSGCRGDVTTYEEDGQIMVKCPGCAPEGVACDRCKPGPGVR